MKALSDSDTFEALEARVTTLETGTAPITAPTFTGLVTIDGEDQDEKLRLVGSNGPYMNAQNLDGDSMGYISWFDSGSAKIASLAAVDRVSLVVNATEIVTVGPDGVNIGAQFSVSDTSLHHGGLPTFADNAAATTGGLPVGNFYRTATGQLMVRY